MKMRIQNLQAELDNHSTNQRLTGVNDVKPLKNDYSISRIRTSDEPWHEIRLELNDWSNQSDDIDDPS